MSAVSAVEPKMAGERETFSTEAGEAAKDNEKSRKATRSEGDDCEESAARAFMRHGGQGRGGRD